MLVYNLMITLYLQSGRKHIFVFLYLTDCQDYITML